MSPVTPYVSIEDLADTLHVPDKGPISLREVNNAAVEAAEIINDFCHRQFHLFTETRTFDAVPSERLLVADLVTTSALSWFGVPLNGTADYVLLPRQNTGDYRTVLRLYLPQGSLYQSTLRWDYDPTTGAIKGQPFGQIVITGTWAYQAQQVSGVWTEIVPSKIVRANVILASRLWAMRDLRYHGVGGGAGNTGRRTLPPDLMDDVVEDLLNLFVLQPIQQRVGSPYGD